MKRAYILILVVTDLFVFATISFATIRYVPSQYTSIQSAISACVDGDTIFVAKGIYTENINFLGKQILLRATGKPGEVVIDGNHKAATVQFISGEGSQTILDGFKIINGENSYGGGIYFSGSSPTIRNCIITANHGFYHGGIGIFSGSNPNILNCIIYGNSAVQSAVGIDQSSPSIINCTIVMNAGSAIFCWNSGNPIIANNILAFNSGYGVYRYGSANPTLRKNDVYADTSGLYYSVNAGMDDFFSDPLFVSAIDADFNLGPNSPCISVALKEFSPNYDAYGHVRPLGSWFDIGAIEEYDGGAILSVENSQQQVIPEDFVLKQNYPNPFNPSTIIEYTLQNESNVAIRIFDIKGALIKNTHQGLQVSGTHEFLWNGTNNAGLQVSSGVYFYNVEVNNIQQTRKMVLLK